MSIDGPSRQPDEEPDRPREGPRPGEPADHRGSVRLSPRPASIGLCPASHVHGFATPGVHGVRLGTYSAAGTRVRMTVCVEGTLSGYKNGMVRQHGSSRGLLTRLHISMNVAFYPIEGSFDKSHNRLTSSARRLVIQAAYPL
jgi:hypothetical protein